MKATTERTTETKTWKRSTKDEVSQDRKHVHRIDMHKYNFYIYMTPNSMQTHRTFFAKGPDEKCVCSARFTELRKQTIQRLKHSKSHCSDYAICQALWWKHKRAPMLWVAEGMEEAQKDCSRMETWDLWLQTHLFCKGAWWEICVLSEIHRAEKTNHPTMEAFEVPLQWLCDMPSTLVETQKSSNVVSPIQPQVSGGVEVECTKNKVVWLSSRRRCT